MEKLKLEVKDLKKTFDNQEVLHGISFTVESGKALGLLGRNGAGKTTTIRILMDVFKASSGEILLNGKKFNIEKAKIGYLPEERGMYPTRKISEQIKYFAMLRGCSKKEAEENTEYYLKKLQVDEFKDRKLQELSKGNQQKVQIAETLVCNPEIVILDEPFSGLDPVNSQVLKDVIKELIEEQKIVIFSSHQMNYVEEFCEDIIIIKKGESVLQGNLKEIKKTYSKGRIVLSAVNYSINELKNIIETDFEDIAEIEKVTKENIILTLKEGITKKDFIKKVLETEIEIEQFGDYEPKLQDIFVLKAGDEK